MPLDTQSETPVTTVPPFEERALDSGTLNELLTADGGPCVSIYMPTHRRSAATRENPIRYKSLAKEAVHALRKHHNQEEANTLAKLFPALEDDNDFWQHQLDGLAIFASPSKQLVIRVQRPLPERVEVADSFHVKPLIRAMQAAGRYQVLCLTQKNIQLLEGTPDALDTVPLHPDVPRTLVEALGPEVSGGVNVNHYGGLSYNGMFHGHHDNKDDRDGDLTNFFRAVDGTIWEHHSRQSNLPLFIAAIEDYHDRFQKVTRNPQIRKERIELHPDGVPLERIREELEHIVRDEYHKQIENYAERFRTAKAQNQGSDDLEEVAKAAAVGRVDTIMLDADKQVGGKIDPASGKITFGDINDPDVDDVIDDLAEMTLRTSSTVLVLPPDLMPSDTGVAAWFRY